jgi:death on curing protein
VSERPFSVDFALRVHELVITASGGPGDLRDRALLQSALETPFGRFEGRDLYPGLVNRAATLAYSIITDHPFVDGTIRTAAVLMITFLRLNGMDLKASDSEFEEVLAALASGVMARGTLAEWLEAHVKTLSP